MTSVAQTMSRPAPHLEGLYGRCQEGAHDLPPPQQRDLEVSLAPDVWVALPAGHKECSCHIQEGDFVAFHGTLFNTETLRRELQAQESASAATLILMAWRRWGPRCLNRLDAEMSFVLRERKHDPAAVYLYSDRSATHPLYFRLLPQGGIAFASRLRLMPKCLGMNLQISLVGLHEYLRFLDISPPNTPYDGIQAAVAGELVCIRHGQVSVIDLPPPSTPHCGSFTEAISVLETLLNASVAARLQTSRSPAAFLSGGIDSALVCALASRHRPDLEAVTVGFDTPEFDESPVAERIARHLGLRHRVLRFDWNDLTRGFELFYARSELPTADPACTPTLLAFRDCADRHDVVLDGIGADDLVGIMPSRHTRVAIEYGARLPLTLRRAMVRIMHKIPLLRDYTPILDFTHPAELLIRWHGFTAEEIERLTGHRALLEQTRFYQAFARFPANAHFERYTALVQCGPSDRLHQAALMTGLPAHLPYLENVVAAFIESLPQGFRYTAREPKRILRALLQRHVPRELWEGPKHGFDFPFRRFLAAEDNQLVRRYLLEGDRSCWNLIAAREVESYARRFLAGDVSIAFRVWTLVVLAAWLQSQAETADTTYVQGRT